MNILFIRRNRFTSEEFNPLVLWFHDAKTEMQYWTQADSFFKLYITCASVVFLGMAILHLLILPR